MPGPSGRDDFGRLVAAVVEAVQAAQAVGTGGRGYTTADVAELLRVGEDKVRAWIASGELAATNTAAVLSGKPRWVVSEEALAAFRARRSSAPAPKPARRKRSTGQTDYFPD